MKINGDYLEFTDAELNKRSKSKLGGHSFSEILGLNSYTKVGDALLTHFNIVESDFEDKYKRRGDWAEKIAAQVMKKRGHTLRLFNDKNYWGDCFKEILPKQKVNPYFSGVIDIDLPNDNTLVEVKGKSLKDLEEVEKNPPKHEVIQSMLYGYMMGYNEVIMMWIFFDPATEGQIFDNKPITSFKEIKKLEQKYTVNREAIGQLMNKAWGIKAKFLKEKKIPLSEISPKILEKVKAKIKMEEEQRIYHVDFNQFMDDLMKPNSSVVSALSEQNPYKKDSDKETTNSSINPNSYKMDPNANYSDLIDKTNVNGGEQ